MTSPGSERRTWVSRFGPSVKTNWLPSDSNSDGARLGKRRRGVRVSEREVVLLDGEDVREVGADLERELELDGMRCVVHDDDVLLHAVADEAVAPDREHVLLEAACDRVPEIEGGRVVLDLVGRELERPLAVDREDPAREKARVVREEAHHRVGDVSALVRDAERRAFQNRECH